MTGEMNLTAESIVRHDPNNYLKESINQPKPISNSPNQLINRLTNNLPKLVIILIKMALSTSTIDRIEYITEIGEILNIGHVVSSALTSQQMRGDE